LGHQAALRLIVPGRLKPDLEGTSSIKYFRTEPENPVDFLNVHKQYVNFVSGIVGDLCPPIAPPLPQANHHSAMALFGASPTGVFYLGTIEFQPVIEDQIHAAFDERDVNPPIFFCGPKCNLGDDESASVNGGRAILQGEDLEFVHEEFSANVRFSDKEQGNCNRLGRKGNGVEGLVFEC
jgi:hypothetical protein